MRHVSDDDKGRLEEVLDALEDMQLLEPNQWYERNRLQDVIDLRVREVLANMDRLEQPAPHTEPRIVALTEADRKQCYPNGGK